MRQVFLEKGLVVVKEVAQPKLDDHSVLISVHYSFISSGTEAATIATTESDPVFSNIPHKIKSLLLSLANHGINGTATLAKGGLQGSLQSLGYSCSGRIIAVGKKVTSFRSGDFVACAGAGFALHADVVCVPQNLVVAVPGEHYLRQASVTTLGAIALQGVRRAQVQIGEIVCVFGLGLLGQLTVQLAKAAGCTVIGIDILPERMALAKELGADYVFDGKDNQFEKSIEFLTHHKGVDVTLITASSKSNDIVQQSMNVTRKKGRVVVVGEVGMKLERDPFYKKEIDLLISCSYGPGRYDNDYEMEGKDYPYSYVRWTEKRNMEAIVDLIVQQKLRIDPLISQVYELAQADKAYETLNTKKSVGVVLSYAPKDDFEFLPAQKDGLSFEGPIHFMPAQKDAPIKVGIVGAGGFSKTKLMPLVSKLHNVSIAAVADSDYATAENASRTYGATKTFIEEDDLFQDESIDVVLIASPHKFHYDQAVQALCRGKAVFLEKPMVTTFEQFKVLELFLKNNPTAPFCVDYNRSFAPFIQKIKWETVERHSPLVINYRINAGYISPDHSVHQASGAGRIIGEACHIFDLFCFLTGSHPVSVSVEALRPTSDDLFPTDNFSAHISFADGSICSLVYTSIGHTALGKERMELFFDSKSIVMEDFLQLRGYGTAHMFNETVSTPDKGHKAILTSFFNSLRSEKREMPISASRLSMVAQLTLVVDKLACQGGGNQEL